MSLFLISDSKFSHNLSRLYDTVVLDAMCNHFVALYKLQASLFVSKMQVFHDSLHSNKWLVCRLLLLSSEIRFSFRGTYPCVKLKVHKYV